MLEAPNTLAKNDLKIQDNVYINYDTSHARNTADCREKIA